MTPCGWDDVEEDRSHAMLVQGADEAIKSIRATDFRVERIVIDDVVPMHTARDAPFRNVRHMNKD